MARMLSLVIAICCCGCTKESPPPASTPAQPSMTYAESLQILDVERRETERAKTSLDAVEAKMKDLAAKVGEMRAQQDLARNGRKAGRDDAIVMWQERLDPLEKELAKAKGEYETAYATWLDCDKRAAKAEADSKSLRNK